MEKTVTVYESWEETTTAAGENGRREVRFYLKRSDGVLDLAVVGKEKSSRHMSYRIPSRIQRVIFGFDKVVKLRSRREVVQWLDNVVSDSQTQKLPHSDDGIFADKPSCLWNRGMVKGIKLAHCTNEFSWIGSPWMCKRKRKHYYSYLRNGVKISVHDFVYVLSEEDKRLVAYLEDMYEDCRGNKMVEVRWYHKIDEVCSVLPHNFNEREIFFSLSLQDISIECIDGLATVLSPQHYEKFLNEARHTKLDPFVCRSQFEKDSTRPFDITQVKGYWEQEVLRYMFTSSSSSSFKPVTACQQSDDGSKVVGDVYGDTVGVLHRKRLRRSKDEKASLQCIKKKELTDVTCIERWIKSNSGVDCKSDPAMCSGRECGHAALSLRKDTNQSPPPTQFPLVGSQVEILSQDSGLRGCWFRALIIKRHRDKVKVRYQDIQDADDEDKKLEEWLLASRVAFPDEFGLRVSGRTTIRPPPQSSKGGFSCVINVGAVVDVWRHDGWWEGIVVQKDPEDRLHVYFPGEKQQSIFCPSDMRPSQEWLGDSWTNLSGRPDLVASVFKRSVSGTKHVDLKSSCEGSMAQANDSHAREPGRDNSGSFECHLDPGTRKLKDSVAAPDLFDNMLAQWKSSRKRRRARGSSVTKVSDADNDIKSTVEVVGSKRIRIPKSLKVDHDNNCKSVGDSLFSSSSVPPLTSLVMSR